MSNPFETIDSRLTTIESLLLDIKHQHKDDSSAEISKGNEIMTVKQASEFLNLAIPTIYSLTSNRTLPHSKRGKKLYFSKTDLTAWIQSGKRATVSDLKKKAKQNQNNNA